MLHSTPHFISEPRHTPLDGRLKAQLERFMAATERRVLYRLDLGHPEHHAFARDMLLLSGDSPERSPRAFALLDEAHRAAGGRGGVYAHEGDGGAAALTPVLAAAQADSDGEFPPGQIDPYNVLARFDVTGTTNYSANAVSTIPGGTNRTSIVLAFVNTTNSQILDTTTQSTTTYAQGEYFVVPLSGKLSGVSSQQVVSNATFYVYTQASPFPSVYYMSANAAVPATDGCHPPPTAARRRPSTGRTRAPAAAPTRSAPTPIPSSPAGTAAARVGPDTPGATATTGTRRETRPTSPSPSRDR
jgi:hypothetical protein